MYMYSFPEYGGNVLGKKPEELVGVLRVRTKSKRALTAEEITQYVERSWQFVLVDGVICKAPEPKPVPTERTDEEEAEWEELLANAEKAYHAGALLMADSRDISYWGRVSDGTLTVPCPHCDNSEGSVTSGQHGTLEWDMPKTGGGWAVCDSCKKAFAYEYDLDKIEFDR